MGMQDKNIGTDIKNHRIRVIDNIDIVYQGKNYNMFFEFMQCEHWKTRFTNKRNGKELKHPVRELIEKDSIAIDTQFDVPAKQGNLEYMASYRHSGLESEFWKEHLRYTRENILAIINKYSIEKYDRIVLVEEKTREIIDRIGGYREKSALSNGYIKISETWNDSYKVVDIIGKDCTCSVDLVSGRIVG